MGACQPTRLLLKWLKCLVMSCSLVLINSKTLYPFMGSGLLNSTLLLPTGPSVYRTTQGTRGPICPQSFAPFCRIELSFL